MLSAKIKNVSVSLGVLAGKIDGDSWQFISAVRKNLDSLSDQAAEMEAHSLTDTQERGHVQAN